METVLIAVMVWVAFQAITLVRSNVSDKESDKTRIANAPVMRLAFEKNGGNLWMQRGTGEIAVLDLNSSELDLKYSFGQSVIKDFSIDDIGKTILVALEDQQMMVLRDGRTLIQESCDQHQLMLGAMSANGEAAVCIIDGINVQTWDLSGETPETKEFQLDRIANKICLDPQGKKMVIGTNEGGVYVYEIATGNRLQSLEPQGSSVRSLSVAEDGNWLLVVRMCDATLFNLNSGTIEWKRPAEPADEFITGKLSPDGERIVICSTTTGLQIVDRESGVILDRLSESSVSFRYAFHPTSEKLFTGDSKGSVFEWSLDKRLDAARSKECGDYRRIPTPESRQRVLGEIQKLEPERQVHCVERFARPPLPLRVEHGSRLESTGCGIIPSPVAPLLLERRYANFRKGRNVHKHARVHRPVLSITRRKIGR